MSQSGRRESALVVHCRTFCFSFAAHGIKKSRGNVYFLLFFGFLSFFPKKNTPCEIVKFHVKFRAVSEISVKTAKLKSP